MSSSQKIEANRRNAQKSTGPRTLSGKAIASMNSLKHGLCSSKPLLSTENEAQFAQFTSDWVDKLQPLGVHEEFLAEQIIMAVWHLKRVKHLYDGLLEMEIRNNSLLDESIHPFSMTSESYVELGRIDRHRNVLQRTYERSLAELKRLQAERAEEDCSLAEAEQNEPNFPTTGAEVPSPVLLNLPDRVAHQPSS
jgi:hypothetical protein